jgi:hypothetical protein
VVARPNPGRRFDFDRGRHDWGPVWPPEGAQAANAVMSANDSEPTSNSRD